VHTSKFQLEERRKQVASMLAQSMTEKEIADKLGVDQSTVSRDVRVLREMSQQFMYDLAKSDLAYYYKQCLDTMHEAERMIWETYRNKEGKYTPAERKERYQVANMIINSVQARFSMFQDGPSTMSIMSMEERLADIESRQENQRLR
jgi:transcriptional regulator with XRE-family HTH domain